MANVIELEILPDLNFLLPPILAIAKIATMVGLLRTVISMINTFNKIQENTQQRDQPCRRHRAGAFCHGDGFGHGHSACVRARDVQGLDRPVRSPHEEQRPETAPVSAVSQDEYAADSGQIRARSEPFSQRK